MKISHKLLIFFLFLIIFVPTNVFGLEIESYDVDVNILENGNADITEHIILDTKGDISINNNYLDCNGLNSILYVGMDNDLYGSDLYRLSILGDVIAYDSTGTNLDFLKTTIKTGENYKFTNVKDFYIKYTFLNMVVTHSDLSEVYYNFYRKKFDLNILKSTITFTLPKRSSYLKTTDYNYNYNIQTTDNKIIKFNYSYISSKNINTRIIFDKSIAASIKNTTKNIRSFIETDLNNGLIEKIKYLICIILTIIFWINFIRIVILVIIKYGTNKKYRVNPSMDETLIKRYNYTGINYLMNKDIKVEAFISGILDLLNSGKINVIKNEVGEYILVRSNMGTTLSIDEEYLVNFLFDVIDKKNKNEKDFVKINKIKEFCSDNTSVASFIVNFNVWRTLQVKNAREYRFMVGNEYYFSLRNSMIFSYVLLLLNVFSKTYFALGVVGFIPVTLLVNVMMKLTKRSTIAEEAYKDVLSFKEGLLTLGKSTTNPYRWDTILISSVSMEIGVETERIIKSKIRNNTLVEHYNSKLIDIYRAYSDFSIVKDLQEVLKNAYKKSFFIYAPKRKNKL